MQFLIPGYYYFTSYSFVLEVSLAGTSDASNNTFLAVLYYLARESEW